MKRIMMMLTAALCTLLLAGCSLADILPVPDTPKRVEETVYPYTVIEPQELSYSEGYEPVVSTYSYDALPLESEKLLYRELLEHCYDISEDTDEELGRHPMPQITLDGYPMTEAQVRTAEKALTDDHPEIFWLTGTMGFYSDDSTTMVQIYTNYSPSEINERVNDVRAAADAFYATVPDGLSIYEREKLVHDYLLSSVSYDENIDMDEPDNNHPDVYTVYGALVDQVTVCEGYARAFQMLLNGLGVDCVGVMGESQDQMHMWNAVRMDGGWYNVDVTWDDQEETYARYIYFNVTDDYLLYDHTLSPLYSALEDEEINGRSGEYSAGVMNIFIPSCTAADKSYYDVETPHLSDYDGAAVKSGLLSSAQAQEDYFVFYIDRTMDFSAAVSALFADYPQYFFGYISEVNDSLYDYSIDNSNISYYSHERSRMVAVELHYY